MKILALESSAKAASVAVCEDEFLLAESYQNHGLTHSRTLLPMCQSLLEHCGLTLDEMDLIAVAHGPGSFTGLRIGLSTAKGLAWPAEKPCIGVSTLEAMAWNLAGFGGIACCAMDARRQQVYHARFSLDADAPLRLSQDAAVSIEEVFDALRGEKKRLILVGDGAQLCYDYGKSLDLNLSLAPPNLRFAHAYGVARAALVHAKLGEVTSGAGLSAHYLRLSQAERERLARLNGQTT